MRVSIVAELEGYREHVERMAALLALDTVTVRLTPSATESAFYNHGFGAVCINLDEPASTGLSIVAIIAHELRHQYQYERGWLMGFGRWGNLYSGRWHGELVARRIDNQEAYEQLPWEQDANAFADSYCAQFETTERRAA